MVHLATSFRRTQRWFRVSWKPCFLDYFSFVSKYIKCLFQVKSSNIKRKYWEKPNWCIFFLFEVFENKDGCFCHNSYMERCHVSWLKGTSSSRVICRGVSGLPRTFPPPPPFSKKRMEISIFFFKYVYIFLSVLELFLPTQKYAIYRGYHMTRCIITSYSEDDANLRNPKFHMFLAHW